MDPFEQRLRDEVLYLHSLWHQGPPRNPNPNPNRVKPNHNPSINLHHPSNPTPFKKDTTTNNKKKPRRKRGKNKNPESDPPPPLPISTVEWPCPATPPATTAWPNLKPNSAQPTQSTSTQEQARYASAQTQQNALKASQEFFTSNAGSGSDNDDDDDSMDEDGPRPGPESDQCEEFKFFMKVFTEDNELRNYYEKKHESGDFCCLVCGGIGKKVTKRFKNCVALVQHSIAISKTKKKWAHRAFGRVICKVLGWDINRLPTIVLSLGDSLGRPLAKPVELQGGSNGNADCDKSEFDVIKTNTDDNGEIVLKEGLPDKTIGSSNVVTGELVVCENSLKQNDANSTEGAANCPESLKEDGVGSVGNEIKDIQNEIVVLDGLKEDDANQEYLDKEAIEMTTVNIEEAKDCTVSLKGDGVPIQMEDFQKDVVVSVGTNEEKLVEDICKVNSIRTDY